MTSPLAELAIAIIAPTPAAVAIGHKLRTGLPHATLWTNPSTAAAFLPLDGIAAVQQYESSLKDLVKQLWSSADALIFILATGATVRLIAPLLADKFSDPAVVVVDEAERFAIGLSGGHVAGGDSLTTTVSALLAATPVLSSGSIAYHLPPLDTLGDPFGWQRGAGDWTEVASAIVRAAGAGNPQVQVRQTCGWNIWRECLPNSHPFLFSNSNGAVTNGVLSPDSNANSDSNASTATVWISDLHPPNALAAPYVCWHPRTLWIGVGCERGTAATTIEAAIRAGLQNCGLAWEAIAGLASIDIKQDEIGLLEVLQNHDWPIVWFPTETLKTIPVPHPSEVVERAVGTPSVAEAAALLAANATALVAEKSVLRTPEAGACTVAIARAEREYCQRVGQLHLVGIGPGSLEHITPAARAAIAQADAIVGYQLYLDLITPLISPQQIVRASSITQEVQRAETAISLARRGLSVAVISSGDCGIYGMAGLVMEQLAGSNWDGQSPQVEVIPGITALQAAAARVGTPLNA